MKSLRRRNKVSIPLTDSLEESVSEDNVCTTDKCIDDKNKDRLICKSCNRYVHYLCSELPAYYIQRLINALKDNKKDKDGHRFICSNCVNVSKDLADKIPIRAALQRDIEHCENILKQNEVNTKEQEREFKKVHKEMKELKAKLKKDPALHTVEYLESKFEDKLLSVGKEIKESILEEIKNILPDEKSMPKTYAGAAAKHTEDSIKKIVVRARNEEIEQQNDKKRRATNIIIHGVAEPTSKDTAQEEDQQFVNQLIEDLKVRVPILNIVKVTRIGKHADGKTRPLKIVMSEEKHKETVFNNLSNLKQYPRYKGVGLTDDFTFAERELLKDWANKAKSKNESETDESVMWRVRGSPKNGLFLKKFPKHQTQKPN